MHAIRAVLLNFELRQYKTRQNGTNCVQQLGVRASPLPIIP